MHFISLNSQLFYKDHKKCHSEWLLLQHIVIFYGLFAKMQVIFKAVLVLKHDMPSVQSVHMVTLNRIWAIRLDCFKKALRAVRG